MNKKSYSFDLDTFRNMLQICPKLPGQHFVDTLFEEDILAFMRELGYLGTIKLLSDVKVDLLPQPWRTFATIINKCLSGKVTGIDTLRLSRAQILWGLYHQENVDFVYLLWEDLVYQIENKESRKNKYMYYPRFTKVIINHFMSQDQSIPRRNKVDWHMANDDPILTTMRFIPQHEVVQKYGAILPDYLITPAMKESEAFKTYYAFATGKATPKPKYVRRTSKDKTEQAPKASTGKRLKAAAKGAKSGKRRQPAQGLETLSEIALTKAEQLRIVTKQSLIQTHSSHASGSGVHEGTGVTPGVPDVPTYESNDEEISWKTSSDDDDDNEGDDDTANDDHDDADNQSERTESDNEGNAFVHPKFTTHDEEESSDPRVHTPSQSEPSDTEANVDVAQSEYTKEEEVNVEHTYEEEDANDLYRDLNVNLEGRDADMTDAPQITQVIEDTHVTQTPVNPEEIPVTFVADTTPSFAITLSPPPLPLIQQRTQTPLPIPTTAPSTSLLDILNFGSLFGFDNRLKAPEQGFSEFIQTNQYATALSSIPNIIDNYLGSKLKEAVDVAIDKILPRIEKLVNEQLESEVLIRSSNEAKTSHVVAANLSELELKKILIDKKKSNKSIDKSDEQKNLYKALVDMYEADKALLILMAILSLSRDVGIMLMMIKNPLLEYTGGPREDEQERNLNPSSAPAEVPMHTADDFEDLSHQEFDTGLNDDQPEEEAHSHPDWFQQPSRLPSPDRDWNKIVPADHGPAQPWLSNLARQEDPQESFDELMDTPIDFSAFMMNRLKLDWTNPEGQRYPHDLRKPLPLIPNSRGCQVIPFAHFINNDLAYLSGGVSSRTYSTSVTKTKATDYGNIKWIEDLVPSSIWSKVPVSYDKYALWGISHWGRKRQQFYRFVANMESAKDVYSRRRIIIVMKLQIVEWHGYKHLDWIIVRRADDKLYSFKEGDFKRLRLQDIEDMLNLLFCDDTLNDVRTALDDRLKGIQMEYLPQTIWRNSDKERAAAMIQKIDKILKSRRIMRSLEREYTHFYRLSYSELVDIEKKDSIQQAGNPVKEILLKMNLPDHRSILTDSMVTPAKHGRMTKPHSCPRFIANYFNAGYLKMEVKVPDSS
ncbi:hypothetical protein Tco_1045683 [Tanacetum coccineum]|uniref:Uncharacterized protein n=1 Tax=Tanacetum coccineum TaxID=301880 RepID=A0ABQ5GTH4_9ASTR